jgi:hypothetical protein
MDGQGRRRKGKKKETPKRISRVWGVRYRPSCLLPWWLRLSSSSSSLFVSLFLFPSPPPILPLASLHIINQTATSSSSSSAAVGIFFVFLVGGFFYFQGPTTSVYVSFSGQKWFAATWGWGG